MLEIFSIILVVLWALGFFAFQLGNMIHLLLLLVGCGLVVRLMQGGENLFAEKKPK